MQPHRSQPQNLRRSKRLQESLKTPISGNEERKPNEKNEGKKRPVGRPKTPRRRPAGRRAMPKGSGINIQRRFEEAIYRARYLQALRANLQSRLSLPPRPSPLKNGFVGLTPPNGSCFRMSAELTNKGCRPQEEDTMNLCRFVKKGGTNKMKSNFSLEMCTPKAVFPVANKATKTAKKGSSKKKAPKAPSSVAKTATKAAKKPSNSSDNSTSRKRK